MSEKFKGIWRKVKERISLAIVPVTSTCLAVLFTAVGILLWAVIRGIIISVWWNVAMTTMLGFQKITIFQASLLAFTIASFKVNYVSSVQSQYEELKKKNFNKSNKEKMAKIKSAILVVVVELILILISVWGLMYFWNTTLPKLLNMELI